MEKEVHLVSPQFGVERQVSMRQVSLRPVVTADPPGVHSSSPLDEIPITAVKTGMLSTAGVVCHVAHTVTLLAQRGASKQQQPIDVDPTTCMSTSGHTLL